MSGFNFGQISNTISRFFNIDLIDIRRNNEELYSNIPCNIQMNSADNANPETVDVTPIVTSLTIHLDNDVDIKNNDYIIAKKLDHKGNLLATYGGVCGYPSQYQSRKTINMKMSSLDDSGEITPPPPINKINIYINYLDIENNTLKDSIIKEVEKGTNVVIEPDAIENYNTKESYLDGELQENVDVTIEDVQEEHNIKFIYELINIPTSFKPLLYGMYTKDNGALAYGSHLYKALDCITISGSNGNYTLKTFFNEFNHNEMGNILLEKDFKMKLNTNEYVTIDSDLEEVENGYIFNTIPYTPNEEEQNAYVTHWYD